MPDTYDARPLDVIYDLAVKAEVRRLANVAGKELAMVGLGDADHRLRARIANAQRALDNADALLAPPASGPIEVTL
jgi:hypothetical protein